MDEELFRVYFRDMELGELKRAGAAAPAGESSPVRAQKQKQAMEMTEYGKHGKP